MIVVVVVSCSDPNLVLLQFEEVELNILFFPTTPRTPSPLLQLWHFLVYFLRALLCHVHNSQPPPPPQEAQNFFDLKKGLYARNPLPHSLRSSETLESVLRLLEDERT